MTPGVWIGVAVLLNVDPAIAKIVAGAVIILVATLTLLAPKLQIKQRWVDPVGLGAGFCGGLLGGVAALSGPLVFIFLLAKGLRGRMFTKEASMFLVVSSILLAMGRLPMHNVIPRLSATPGRLRRPAPALGEHTAEILVALGLDRAELDGLARDGIIGLGGGTS